MKVDGHTINFGSEGYEDYTTHKSVSRKERYEARHKPSEDWSKTGIDTPGFWAKHILWNKPNLTDSIKDTERRFGVKIKRV